MLVNQIIDNLHHNSTPWTNHQIDYLELDWYELPKRILRKFTQQNREVGIQLASGAHSLCDGDILVVDDDTIIVVMVKPIECLALVAKTHYELAKMCYEIGNRHAPLFIDEHDHNVLLMPNDKPLQQMLEKMGFSLQVVMARLIYPLSAGGAHHHHHEH